MRELRPIAGLVLAFAVGLLLWGVAALVYIPPSSVKREADPFGLIQTGLGLLVGFFLTQFLTLRVSERKADKEIVIRYVYQVVDAVQEAADALEAIEETSPVTSERRRTLNRKTQSLGVRINNLGELLRLCDSDKSLDGSFKDLIKLLTKFREAVGEELPPTDKNRSAAGQATQTMLKNLARLAISVNRLPH